MYKQIKKLTVLLFVAATMFTFSSCNKDNNDDNPSNPSSGGGTSSTNYPESVNGTYWIWSAESGDVVFFSIRFMQNNDQCTMAYTNGNYESRNYNGTFTYSNGSGSMDMERRSTGERMTLAFTVNDSTLTTQLLGVTYSLAKQ